MSFEKCALIADFGLLIFSYLVPPEEVFKKSSGSPFVERTKLAFFSKVLVEHTLKSKAVRELSLRSDLQFDLVINEEFFHDAYLMFGHKFKAPVVTFCKYFFHNCVNCIIKIALILLIQGSYGSADFFDRQMGLLTPWSHVPHSSLTSTDKMSFAERWYNTVFSAYDWIVRYFIHIPGQNELAKKYFSHLKPSPSIEDLIENVSLILVNAHRSISTPRPSMPSVFKFKKKIRWVHSILIIYIISDHQHWRSAH